VAPPVAADHLAVARIVKAHGIRGELRVLPLAEGSRALDDVAEVVVAPLGGPARSYRVRRCHPVDTGWVLELDGIADRDAAEALRGARIDVARGALELAPGEFFVADLVGCQAVDLAGGALGQVAEVLSMPAQDVLVLRDG